MNDSTSSAADEGEQYADLLAFFRCPDSRKLETGHPKGDGEQEPVVIHETFGVRLESWTEAHSAGVVISHSVFEPPCGPADQPFEVVLSRTFRNGVMVYQATQRVSLGPEGQFLARRIAARATRAVILRNLHGSPSQACPNDLPLFSGGEA